MRGSSRFIPIACAIGAALAGCTYYRTDVPTVAAVPVTPAAAVVTTPAPTVVTPSSSVIVTPAR